MSLAAFLENLQKHGEDLSIWPEADRRAAAVLLAENDAARIAIVEMQALRQALKPAPGMVRAPAHLTDKIMRAVSSSTGTSHEILPPASERRRP
jgi:hypothetical protein